MLDRRVAVVVNGNAKRVTDEVIATLDDILAGGDLFVSRHVEQSAEIAVMLLDRGYETVLTGGGDGTFTALVTAVAREADRRGVQRPRFGLLRLGTGNSLAWVVGASPAHASGKGLAVDIQRLREDAGSRPMRLIEVEGKLTPFCGVGMDADVLHDYIRTKDFLARGPLRAWAPGSLSYFLAATTQSIPSYLVRPMPHLRVVNLGAEAFRVGESGQAVGAPVRKGEVLYEGPMRLAACSTIPYYGFGFRVFPFALEREGRMQLRIATIGSMRNFRAIWSGRYHNPISLFDYWVEHVRFDLDPAIAFQVGGDAMGDRRSLEIHLDALPIRLVDFYAPPRA